jgi:acyl carrier protein
MANTTELLRAVLAEHGRLGVDVASLSDTDDLHAAGLSSHATVSVMVAIEDALDIEFPDRMLNRRTFETIAALRESVDGLVISA